MNTQFIQPLQFYNDTLVYQVVRRRTILYIERHAKSAEINLLQRKQNEKLETRWSA